jgi:hypothetical protein
LSEAEATPGPADVPNVWGVIWLIGVVVMGLFLLFKGFATQPPERSALTAADHIGPISYSTPLVSYSTGRRRGTYRTQSIPLAIPGFGLSHVSPPPTLWVNGIDSIGYGQRVEFLVDPHGLMVFEARSGGRTLLSYEASAANRRARGRGLILAGLFCLGVAALQGFNMRRSA